MAKVQGQTREVTLDNITKEDILAMAQTIQQYEQLIKAQKGYIIQLETQLGQRNKQVRDLKSQQDTITNFIEVEANLDIIE